MAKGYDELIARLDVAARVRLPTGASRSALAGDDRIGLAQMAFSDGPTWVRGLTFDGERVVTLLPNATLPVARGLGDLRCRLPAGGS